MNDPVVHLEAMTIACSRVVTETKLDLVLFGIAMRRLRQDAGITLRDMAGRLKISAPFLSDVELGRRGMKYASKVKFISECHISPHGGAGKGEG